MTAYWYFLINLQLSNQWQKCGPFSLSHLSLSIGTNTHFPIFYNQNRRMSFCQKTNSFSLWEYSAYFLFFFIFFFSILSRRYSMIFDILLIRKLSNLSRVHVTLNKIFCHFHAYKFCLLSFKLLCSTDGIVS